MEELDYKEEIIKLVENIDDENKLAYLYFFIKNKIKAEDWFPCFFVILTYYLWLCCISNIKFVDFRLMLFHLLILV